MLINPTVNKVLSFIRKNDLIQQNDRCLLGVSGGPDSVTLLDIFVNLHDIFGINLGIAHVNYNLRGNYSIDEENYVKLLAEYYKLPFFSLSINLNEILKVQKGSLENTARNIRFGFFEKIATENNYSSVALAHNANDQAETVIMKLIRGSISGLKGIDSKREISPENKNISVVRPLLCLSRKEIEDYCLEKNLKPKYDLSNFDDDFTRNRIRKNLIPLLNDENPNFFEILQQTTNVLNQENKFLNNLAKEYLNKCIISKDEKMLILSNKEIQILDDFLQRRIFNAAYEFISNDEKSFSYKNLEAIRSNIKKGESGKLIELPNNLFFTKDRDYLIFSKGKPCFEIKKFFHKISSEKVFINELNLFVEIKDISHNFTFEKFYGNNYITFSPGDSNISLCIESYSPEKEFIPFGKSTPVKIKEFLDKKKIPEMKRKDIFLLTMDNKIVWINGIARSNDYLVKNDSLYIMELSIRGKA